MAPQSLAGCYYSIVQRSESTPCAKDSAIPIRSRSRNNIVRQLDQIFGKLLLILTIDDHRKRSVLRMHHGFRGDSARVGVQ